jgi:hypothetical protein
MMVLRQEMRGLRRRTGRRNKEKGEKGEELMRRREKEAKPEKR